MRAGLHLGGDWQTAAHGPDPAHGRFLYSPHAEKVFYVYENKEHVTFRGPQKH